MSYLKRKQKANPLTAGNLQTRMNELLPTIKYSDIRLPSQQPDFKMIRIPQDDGIFKFHKVFFHSQSEKLYVRTDRLPRPFPTKFGNVLILNPKTKRIESAKNMAWEQWIELKNNLNLLQVDFDYVEVRKDALMVAFGVRA